MSVVLLLAFFLASCKLELTVLELVVTISFSTHKSAKRLYTSLLLCAREDCTLQYFKRHLLVGVTYVRAAVLGSDIYLSVVTFVGDHTGRTVSRLSKSNKRETCVLAI